MLEPEIPKSRQRLGDALFALVALLAIGLTTIVLTRLDLRPRTNDAEVGASVVHVSAGVPGRVVRVAASNDARVAAGDILFELDDTVHRLLRDQAAAQLDAAVAALADAKRASQAAAENAASAVEEITRARKNLELAEATVARLEPLAATAAASQQSLDEARTAAENMRISLNVAQRTARAASDLVASDEALEAEVRAAEALLATAEYNLSQTKVVAPTDGFVTALKLGVGSWVLPEQPALVLIDDGSWHVSAFFRETDLATITPGKPVRIRILSNPDIVVKGKVKSIGRGVQTTEALGFNGFLPIVQQSTDWVRLANRFPVHIEIEPPFPPFLRIGASASVTIGVAE